jgi:hypothetical protein
MKFYMLTKLTWGSGSPKLIILKFGFLFSLAILYSSCGLLRKVEKEVSEDLQEQHTSVRTDSIGLYELHSTALYLKHRSDYDSSLYTLEIWPSGKFSIGADGAFIGEAQKIRLHGQHIKTSNSSQLRQQAEVKSSLNSLIKKETHQTKVLQKHAMLKKNPAWKWVLLMLGFLILLYVLLPSKALVRET